MRRSRFRCASLVSAYPGGVACSTLIFRSPAAPTYTPPGYSHGQFRQVHSDTEGMVSPATEPAKLPVVTVHVWDVTSARLPAALWHMAADGRARPRGMTFAKLV